MKFESYYTTKTPHDLVFKYCGVEECAPDFSMYPHTRAEYLIHYIIKGKGRYICEGKEYPIEKGELFVIFPSSLVSYRTLPEDPLHFFWFAFSGTKAPEVIAQLGFLDAEPVRKLHPQYSIHELIQNQLNLLDSPVSTNDFMVQAMLYHILSNIAESYHLSSSYNKENRDILFEHVEKAKSYIKCNYSYPISVKDVVDHVGLERSYFSKIFHKYTGITAQKYILSIRIAQSRLLLEKSSYSIKEISSYVGINDEYYFSRAFKKSLGLSPSQYRNAFHIA